MSQQQSRSRTKEFSVNPKAHFARLAQQPLLCQSEVRLHHLRNFSDLQGLKDKIWVCLTSHTYIHFAFHCLVSENHCVYTSRMHPFNKTAGDRAETSEIAPSKGSNL